MDDGHFILLPLLPCHLVLDFLCRGKMSIIGAVSEEEMCVKSGNSEGSQIEQEDER